MQKFAVVVDTVLEYSGKYLLIRRPMGGHGEGLLCLVGGKIDMSDGAGGANALLQAAKREVLEEVGLDLKDPVVFCTSSAFTDSRGIDALAVIFYCKLEKTKADVVPALDEVPEYLWMSFEEIQCAPDAPEWTTRYIEAARQMPK